MAKRRRAYRGTRTEHRDVAKATLPRVRRAATSLRKALARNDCYSGYSHLRDLLKLSSAYSHESYWGDPRNRGAAMKRAESNLWYKFYEKCIGR